MDNIHTLSVKTLMITSVKIWRPKNTKNNELSNPVRLKKNSVERRWRRYDESNQRTGKPFFYTTLDTSTFLSMNVTLFLDPPLNFFMSEGISGKIREMAYFMQNMILPEWRHGTNFNPHSFLTFSICYLKAACIAKHYQTNEMQHHGNYNMGKVGNGSGLKFIWWRRSTGFTFRINYTIP